jgi:polysaccharide biosynthesis transport protein
MPSPETAPSRPTPASSFDLKTLWHVLLERFWIILLCGVVSILGAVAYIQRAPVLYAATATIRVEPEEQKVIKVEKVSPDDRGGLDALRTIEQSLKSRSLLERVATANNLAKDPSFLGSPVEPTSQQLAGVLNNIITARLRRGARFIDVTVTHPNPEVPPKIANSLVREYLAMSFEQNNSASTEAASFLATESRRLKGELDKAEAALQRFRDEKKAVSLEEKNDIVNARLKELSALATTASSESLKAQADLAQVQQAGTNVAALLVLTPVTADPSVAEARSAISKMESEFASVRLRYKEAHPKYIEKVNQIAEWKRTLTNAALKVPQTLKSTHDAARGTEAALQAELEKQQEISRKLSDDVMQYQKLVRDVDSTRALYDSVQTRMKETMLMRELKPSKVVLQDPAIPERTPVSPNKRSIMMKAVMAGIFAGILFAVGLNALDSSIKTVDQAEEYLHLPVLSAIPQLSSKGHIVVKETGSSPGAESFRTLRTSLSMLGRAEHRRTFLFTSALPSEGKTFCSMNYALSLAQQGLKTLLIDGDLRRPSVQKYLVGNRSPMIGVTDFLTGAKTFDEVVQHHANANFDYITAGTTAPNPAELLSQNGVVPLVDEALQRYDRVVVDCAPIHAVSDTLLMLGRIQTVCLVVRANKTPRRAVGRALELLYKAEAPVAGIILNRQKARGLSRYYYDTYYTYQYYGKYGHKGVYGSK